MRRLVDPAPRLSRVHAANNQRVASVQWTLTRDRDLRTLKRAAGMAAGVCSLHWLTRG